MHSCSTDWMGTVISLHPWYLFGKCEGALWGNFTCAILSNYAKRRYRKPKPLQFVLCKPLWLELSSQFYTIFCVNDIWIALLSNPTCDIDVACGLYWLYCHMIRAVNSVPLKSLRSFWIIATAFVERLSDGSRKTFVPGLLRRARNLMVEPITPGLLPRANLGSVPQRNPM